MNKIFCLLVRARHPGRDHISTQKNHQFLLNSGFLFVLILISTGCSVINELSGSSGSAGDGPFVVDDSDPTTELILTTSETLDENFVLTSSESLTITIAGGSPPYTINSSAELAASLDGLNLTVTPTISVPQTLTDLSVTVNDDDGKSSTLNFQGVRAGSVVEAAFGQDGDKVFANDFGIAVHYIDSDGNIFLGGVIANDGAITKIKANGDVDTDFASNGFAYIDETAGPDRVMGIYPSGPSHFNVYINRYLNREMSVRRYTNDGVLDTGFGTAGSKLVVDDIEPGYPTQLNDGHFVVPGYKSNDISVVKFDIEGNLVTTFGTSGIWTTAVSDSDSLRFHNQVIEMPSGELLSVGSHLPTGESVWRQFAVGLDSSGQPLPSFQSSGGYIKSNAAVTLHQLPKYIYLDSTNLLVTHTTDSWSQLFTQLTSSGFVEISIEAGSSLIYDFYNGLGDMTGAAMVSTTKIGDSIYTFGGINEGTHWTAYLRRYDSDLIPDARFAEQGEFRRDMGEPTGAVDRVYQSPDREDQLIILGRREADLGGNEHYIYKIWK